MRHGYLVFLVILFLVFGTQPTSAANSDASSPIISSLVTPRNSAVSPYLPSLQEAASALTVDVSSDNHPSGLGKTFVVVQRCMNKNQNPCASGWSENIQTDETANDGTASFNIKVNWAYRIVVTKDGYYCDTPASCKSTVFATSTAPIVKTFLLDNPTRSTSDICSNRRRNKEALAENQRKVVENGVEWNDKIPDWMRLFSANYHTWYVNAQLPPQVPALTGLILKLDHLISYDNTAITQTAQAFPGSWWIMGEEANEKLSLANCQKCRTPTQYAQWYHDKTQLILSADPTAKFIFGYFGQVDPVSFEEPVGYAKQVFAVWKANTTWCAEPPIDAIHVNYTPYVEPMSEWSEFEHLVDYVNYWRDSMYDGGSNGMWLANEMFSFGTGQQWDIPTTGAPTQEQANGYIQGAMGTLLNPAANKFPFVLFGMNYAGYGTCCNNRLPSELERDDCLSSSNCPYPNPLDGIRDYGKVFANFAYRNAGWELGTLQNWTQVNASGAGITKFNVVADAETYSLGINVKSDYAVEFIDNTGTSGYCFTQSCYFNSELIPLPHSAGQVFRTELDYQPIVGIGTGTIRLEVKFFDANGTLTGSNGCNTSYTNTGTWQHISCDLSAPSNKANAQFSIKITPAQTSASNTIRFDNASAYFIQ